jgi:hypothetical protein
VYIYNSSGKSGDFWRPSWENSGAVKMDLLQTFLHTRKSYFWSSRNPVLNQSSQIFFGFDFPLPKKRRTNQISISGNRFFLSLEKMWHYQKRDKNRCQLNFPKWRFYCHTLRFRPRKCEQKSGQHKQKMGSFINSW